jgi:hypothetical protein
LGGGFEKKNSASFAENGEHMDKTFLIENYDLNFRHKNESQSKGKENLYGVGFFTISNNQAHIRRWHTWPAQEKTTSCTRVYVWDQG